MICLLVHLIMMEPSPGSREVSKLRNASDLSSDFSCHFFSTTKEDLVRNSFWGYGLIGCCIFLEYWIAKMERYTNG